MKICVTLVTDITIFQFRHLVSIGHNQLFAVGPWHLAGDIPSTIITTASHKGITCLITQWIYIQQVIIVTTGYLWLMVCVSTVHAAFVFIGNQACWVMLLRGSVYHLDDCGVCVCVCVCNSSKCLPVGHHFCCFHVSILLSVAVKQRKHRAPFTGDHAITTETWFTVPRRLWY